MIWFLLAEETTDISALLKLGGAMGIAGAIGIFVRHLYGVWRTYKSDESKDAADKLANDIKAGEAKLALNIKEEAAVEAQLQRVISQQDNLITKLQSQKDTLQNSINDMVARLARAETTEKFLDQQLKEAMRALAEHREQHDALRKKYYTLKNGIKPDSDVIPPSGTEIAPET